MGAQTIIHETEICVHVAEIACGALTQPLIGSTCFA